MKHIFTLAFVLFYVSAYSQDTIQSESLTQARAKFLFKDENYLSALPLYLELSKKDTNNTDYLFKIGVCYLHKNDEHRKAIDYLEKVNRKDPRYEDLMLYLGRAYFVNYQFEKANEFLSAFIEKETSDKKKAIGEQYLQYLTNAKALVKDSLSVKITNLGDGVNSQYSEYVPVITSDESMMLFTYRGKNSKGGLMNHQLKSDPDGIYYEDVYISYKTGDKWGNSKSLDDVINTNGHDAAVGISNDGQTLLIYKNNERQYGDLFISRASGNEWSVPEKLKGDVNSEYWEGSASFTADLRTIYFSSERPGGFGGKDLYRATLQPDSTWGQVLNLGPEINSSADEDAPYIHPTGRILVFSSNGLKSMGGYDFFSADKKGEGWTMPVNLGYPINTTDDDVFYVLSADGKKGYFSSDRKGGYGMQDLYEVTPGIKITTPLSLLVIKGTVTTNGKPSSSKIVVKSDGFIVSELTSNSSTGKYLVNLPSDKNYSILYKTGIHNDILKEVTASVADTFIEKTIDVNFEGEQLGVLPPNESYLNSLNYTEYLDKFGTRSGKDVLFKVQIGAFKQPENAKLESVKQFEGFERKKFEDGLTRFTVGTAKTLKEADSLKEKAQMAGIRDAFVTAEYKGKRILLKELFSTILK